ncbi:MAG TPA: enterotoxin [Gemmatimonadales bacterium]
MTSRRDFLTRAAAALWAARLRRVAVRSTPDDLTLANDLVSASWSVSDGRLRAVQVVDRAGGAPLALPPDVFSLLLRDGTTIGSSALVVRGAPRIEMLAADARAARASQRVPGRQLVVELGDSDGKLRATWRALVRDGSRYLRQELELASTGEPLAIEEIHLLDLDLPEATVVGSVRGSPIVGRGWFAGFEHPLSQSRVAGARARAWLDRELPLRPGAPLVCSAVIGATGSTRVRRAFLEYLERERAHPYRPFLHYNSWYDLGYFSKFDEAGALEVIRAFGTELHERRGVVLDSFLFDDGWDDAATLWHFHAGFPHGFTAVRAAAARYGAAPGVWMSPWGGYGKPKEDRLAFGRAQGFETNEGGFALSGPKYFARFRETCLSMIRDYGVNQFKFDGTGNVAHAIPGSAFDSDFDAMIALIDDLRVARPDLFINLTTGTYPSPFFLRYADSIWRGGEDHDFAGVGSDRQQWITYRDADTYRGIVRQGPLFPLNSLMLHGLVYAKHANRLMTDPGGDFASEIRAYFGTGTQLQEMYVSPSLLTAENWDTLAETARWARARAATLVDTHWVGGDPGALEVYGHAAWGGGRGVLVLRNPRDAPQTIALDVAGALELPDHVAGPFTARSPWRSEHDRPRLRLAAGTPHEFTLSPFEVLTLDLTP